MRTPEIFLDQFSRRVCVGVPKDFTPAEVERIAEKALPGVERITRNGVVHAVLIETFREVGRDD